MAHVFNSSGKSPKECWDAYVAPFFGQENLSYFERTSKDNNDIILFDSQGNIKTNIPFDDKKTFTLLECDMNKPVKNSQKNYYIKCKIDGEEYWIRGSNVKKQTKANAGDVMEVIYACGYYYMFTKSKDIYSSKEVKIPNQTDLSRLVKSLDWSERVSGKNAQGAKLQKVSVRHKDGTVDNVSCVVWLPNAIAEAMKDEKNSNIIEEQISNFIKNVSKSSICREIVTLSTDGVSTNVSIEAIGPLDQTGTKADIKIMVDSKPFVEVSLKNGSDQLAQYGLSENNKGTTIDKLNEAFKKCFKKDICTKHEWDTLQGKDAESLDTRFIWYANKAAKILDGHVNKDILKDLILESMFHGNKNMKFFNASAGIYVDYNTICAVLSLVKNIKIFSETKTTNVKNSNDIKQKAYLYICDTNKNQPIIQVRFRNDNDRTSLYTLLGSHFKKLLKDILG